MQAYYYSNLIIVTIEAIANDLDSILADMTFNDDHFFLG